MSTPRSLFVEGAPILSRDEAQVLTKRVLGFATAEGTRVTIRSGARANSRFAVNQMSTAGDNIDTVVTVLSVFGKRSAVATTNRLDDAGLKAVVENSEKLARLSPEDPETLPELEPQSYRDAVGWSDTTAQLDPTARAAAIKTIIDPARAAGLVSTGYIESRGTALAIANNKGLFAYARNTEAVLTTTVRTPDGQGSGWAGTAHWDWNKINAASLGRVAIQKAQASQKAVAIEPGRYTVILEPTAVGNLVQLIGQALSARSADEGRSFFTKQGGGNKIGAKVVDERVTLLSDPFDPDLGTTPFGGDGMPIERTVWIENGVVKNLAYDRIWAARQQVRPSSIAGGLKMLGGSQSLEELIAGTERGILVTRFWYIRAVDPRTILYTGLTRDGTFLIEKGKITTAVKNFRFNESPIFMLNNLEAMSTAVRVSASESGNTGQAIVVPAIRTRDFSFTSLSDAV